MSVREIRSKLESVILENERAGSTDNSFLTNVTKLTKSRYGRYFRSRESYRHHKDDSTVDTLVTESSESFSCSMNSSSSLEFSVVEVLPSRGKLSEDAPTARSVENTPRLNKSEVSNDGSVLLSWDEQVRRRAKSGRKQVKSVGGPGLKERMHRFQL